MNSPFLQFIRFHLNHYLKKLSFGEFSINFYILRIYKASKPKNYQNKGI